MPRISSRPIMAMLIVIFVLILPAAISAQSFWLERSSGKTLMLEIFKPNVSGGVFNGVNYPVDYSFETLALFLTLRTQIGSKSFLVVELPFAHAAFDTKIDTDFGFYRNSGYSNTIGNPYIGLERGSLNSRFFTEIGLRLPLAETDNNYAARVGRAADPDRGESFEHLAALRAMISYRSKRPRGLTFRARGGALVQRDFDHLRDNYFSIPISTLIGYGHETGRFRFGADFVINIDASYQRVQSYSGFAMNQMQYCQLRGSARLGNLRLGAYLKLPFLDSERASSFNFKLNSFRLDLAMQ